MPQINLVSEDAKFHELVTEKLRGLGIDTCSYQSLDHYFATVDPRNASCQVLDIHGHHERALSWLGKVRKAIPYIQVLLVSRSWELESVVSAMKHGAAEVLEWGKLEQHLTRAVQQAMKAAEDARMELTGGIPGFLVGSLNAEETRVFQMIVQGKTIKQIAAELRLSIRTIHYRKKTLLEKLGVANRSEAIELVRMNSGQLLSA